MASIAAQAGVEWTEIPVLASRRRSAAAGVASVVAILVVPALLALSGRKRFALVVAAVGVTLHLARRVAVVDRVVSRSLQAVSHAVGVALSAVLLSVVHVAVVLPVWAVSRLLRWNHLDRGPGWQDHPKPWTSQPHQPFAYERMPVTNAVRLHRALAVGLVMVVVLVVTPVGPATLDWARARSRPADPLSQTGEPTAPEPLALLPLTGRPPKGIHSMEKRLEAYPGEPWARDLLTQQDALGFAYDPILTVRWPDIDTEHTHIRGRVRQSYRPAGADAADGLDVWLFGGSALFGLGMRDDHTIPSALARAAERDGIPLRVTNFGVSSFIAWQDALLFAQMLSERPKPDLVVMYEGYNDIGHYLSAGSPAEVGNDFAEQIHPVIVAGGVEGLRDEDLGIYTDEVSPQNAANIYNRGVALARSIATANEVPLFQFYQPSLWTRRTPDDRVTYDALDMDAEFHLAFAQRWDLAKALVDRQVVDLSDVLDDLPGVVYWDDVHHNERAGDVIGRAVHRSLEPTLRSLHAEKAARSGPP